MRPTSDPAPPSGTPLYVHVPFCVAKCHYCDFYSFAAVRGDSSGFVELLLREAEHRAGPNPRTVFIGGGTPTWLSEPELRALFDGLDERTGFRASAEEVTIECNPESLDEAKAELLLSLGVRRFSIGFQSLRPELLELFGRVHHAEQSFDAFRAARSAGVEEISVDLIYASPGEKLETWEADLARVMDAGPDHVSAYNLTFEEGTAFEQWRRSGKLEPQAEELELEFFWRTRALLEERGYDAYEISNFALNGRLCKHNLNYWENGPYVGLGPSAVGKVGQKRMGNPRSYEKWSARIRADEWPAFEWEETLEPAARLGETWWLGLRTRDGIDPARARETAGLGKLPDPCLAVADDLCRKELLVLEGSRYRLTRKGLPLADAIARQFLVPDSGPEHRASDREEASSARSSTEE